MTKGNLLLFGLILSGNMFAQQDTTKSLDEVIVTANKIEQKQSTTGKVVSVIGREQIERSAARSVSQLLNEQAGITINGSLNNAGSNISVYTRGATSGRTLILIDGVPAYDPSLINNEFDLNLVSLNNVQRIEISRGAQSTLYGSDAIGGVINIITIPTKIQRPFNAVATLTAGSYGTFRENLQLYGKMDRLTYNLRYGRQDSKGFSAANDKDHVGGFDKDGFHSNDINALLQYEVANGLTVRGFFRRNNFRTEVDAGAYADEKDWVNKSKLLNAGAGFLYKRERLTVSGIYQYSQNDREQVNDSLDVPGFTKYSADYYFSKSQYLEAYANIVLGKGFSLLQGADYRFSSMNNQFLSLSIMPPGPFNPYTSEFRDTVQSQASLFASLFYQGQDTKLNVELGGRVNVHSRYGSNSTYTFNPSYNFNQHFRVFGSVATGFKAPSLYQLYSTFGDPQLKPETSRNYEIGVQQTHEVIRNRVVYFHRVIRNGIDFNNVGFVYYNFLRQEVNGLELETSIQPTEKWRVTFNYTMLDPKEITQSRKTFGDTTYNYLLKRPKHHFNLNAGYTFKNGLYVSAGMKAVSKRYDAAGYMVDDELLKGYVIFNAYAEYRLGKQVKFFADAQNLGDKRFVDSWGYNALPLFVTGGVTLSL